MRDYRFNIGEEINGLKIIDKIRIGKKKAYTVQSLTYKRAKPYNVTKYSLKEGKGDGYVKGDRVCEENSLWSLKNLRKYIVDEEKAKNIRRGSNKKVLLKCDKCNYTKKMSAYDLCRYEFNCKNCSRNISYPERFFMSYLETKDIEYQMQVKLKDINRRIDFYIPSLDIYVETHGVIHYKEQYNSSWKNSHERTLKSDKEKRKWCEENNKLLIELDCRESTFEYIKESINNSEVLPSIYKDETDKIKESIIKNSNNRYKEIIELYKKGLSYIDVSKKIGLVETEVYNILKRANVKMRKINDTRKIKVRCLETGVEYESCTVAAKGLRTNAGSISKCCKGIQKSAGKDKDGNPLHWEYV